MTETLLAMVRAQQRGCAIGGSPLYASLLDDVHADVAAGGPCAAVLVEVAAEPFADAGVLRLLRAVHELVLTGEAPELAQHYPSVGGTPGAGMGAAFLRLVAAHQERLREATRPPLQTNEVGRAAPLVGGFLTVAERHGPRLRVLEVGASAGLNLRWDRFRYEQAGRGVGPVTSPVRFVDPWEPGSRVPPLDAPFEVVERQGCDSEPLDLDHAEDLLRLRASLWPDQPERRARFEAALEVAATTPATVERADAAEWVAAQLGRTVPGATTVVVHSIVLQYLPPATRAALRAHIEGAGRAARPDAPVAWLRMEPASAREAEVRLRSWPDPEGRGDEVLARCGFHGLPIRWGPPPPDGAAEPRSSG